MNLPRWLVIVGILVIVLGILACGIGAGRALDEGRPRATPSPSPTARKDLDLIPLAAVPAGDIVMSGSCARGQTASGATQFTGTGCVLTVEPSGLFPRELRLRVEAGSGSVTVGQVLRDRPQFSTRDLPTPTMAVRIAGSTVTTVIDCGVTQCRLVLVTE